MLVLVNGRRVANYGFAHRTDTLVSFVDLNSIPLAAVERIEFLKDGASALYGSEAMAGVINIVLRENVSGVELQARVGVADDDGAEEQIFKPSANRDWAAAVRPAARCRQRPTTVDD